MSATCDLCGEQNADLLETIDHLRLMHPDKFDDFCEHWPDGEIVVHDLTLDPEDFE